MSRSRRGSRRRSGRSRGNEGGFAKWIAMLVMAVVVAVVSVLVYLNVTTKKTDIDPNSLCDRNSDIQDIVAILIDATEGIPTRTGRDITIYLENVIHSLPANSLVNLYAIESGNEDHITPVMTLCKPVTGAEIDALTGNKRYADKMFKEAFEGPASKLIQKLINKGPSNTSPLIESMQSTVLESFKSRRNLGTDKMIVISDMIQNSNLYSFYKSRPSFFQYKEENIKKGNGILKLDNIEVHLMVIPRSYPQGNRQDLIQFWSELIKFSGAKNGSSMEPLS